MKISLMKRRSLETKKHAGQVGWRSPSNIALVKYWGKYGNQLPQNPSISFTLSQAFTETIINYKSKEGSSELSIDFSFEGKVNDAFQKRIEGFLKKNSEEFKSLDKLHLNIKSKNSFPHSSGIASSASSMSSLALGLCSIENQLLDKPTGGPEFLRRVSHISRLASGSACRSVYPMMAAWGDIPTVEGSQNEYAVELNHVHPVFKDFHDDILIVSREQKSVSSSAGHQLMDNNVYATARYQQAHDRCKDLYAALKSGDVETVGTIVEDEALTLHALMMCSNPSFILMKPNSLEIISRIKEFRVKHKLPVFFTLDAGPNIHVLYPDNIAPQIKEFIDAELLPLCEGNRVIRDIVGNGPEEITQFSL